MLFSMLKKKQIQEKAVPIKNEIISITYPFKIYKVKNTNYLYAESFVGNIQIMSVLENDALPIEAFSAIFSNKLDKVARTAAENGFLSFPRAKQGHSIHKFRWDNTKINSIEIPESTLEKLCISSFNKTKVGLSYCYSALDSWALTEKSKRILNERNAE